MEFVYRRDHQARFKFAWVQSEVGNTIVERCGLPTNKNQTIVYIENGVPYFKSTAVLKAARLLRFPWPILAVGLVIPRPVRDWLYDRVALNRYRIFGRKERCMVPTGDLLERFL